jgi:hypothetical protein
LKDEEIPVQDEYDLENPPKKDQDPHDFSFQNRNSLKRPPPKGVEVKQIDLFNDNLAGHIQALNLEDEDAPVAKKSIEQRKLTAKEIQDNKDI